MSLIMDHQERPDNSLKVGAALLCVLFLGIGIGAKIANTANEHACKEQLQAYKSAHDLEEFRPALDLGALERKPSSPKVVRFE